MDCVRRAAKLSVNIDMFYGKDHNFGYQKPFIVACDNYNGGHCSKPTASNGLGGAAVQDNSAACYIYVGP